MSKKLSVSIIQKIKNDQLKIKPRWMFVLGSTLSVIGLFISGLVTLFAIQLIKFRLTHPGFGASRKILYLLSSLPVYVPALALASLILGYLILRRYDFSYRENRKYVYLIILISLIASSIVLSKLGLDEFLSQKRLFRQMYFEQRHVSPPRLP